MNQASVFSQRSKALFALGVILVTMGGLLKAVTLGAPTILISPSCNYADGSLRINTTSGEPNFIYRLKGLEWDGTVTEYEVLNQSATTQTFNNLPAGFYIATVTDGIEPATGCLGPYSDTVMQCIVFNNDDLPTSYGDELVGTVRDACFYANDGELIITGNNNSYIQINYRVYDLADLEAATGVYSLVPLVEDLNQNNPTVPLGPLAPGTYIVLAQGGDNSYDSLGCVQALNKLTIGQNPELFISCTVTSTDCNGYGGTLTASVSGGTAPWTVDIYGPTSASLGPSIYPEFEFDGLPAGIYTVTVTDDNGCTAVDTCEIPGDLFVSIIKTDLTCFAYSYGDGKLLVRVDSGGIPPYQVELFDAFPLGYPVESLVLNYEGEEACFENLLAGEYWVQFTDSSMPPCQVLSSRTLLEPGELQANANSLCATCNGASDGTILITVSGGTPPYDVNVYGVGMQQGIYGDFSFSGLAAGTYAVSVDDANNCGPVTFDVLVGEPDAIGMPYDMTLCISDYPVELVATTDVDYCQMLDEYGDLEPMQGGGIWTSDGYGLIDNGDGTARFDPAVAGSGTHTLTFTANSDPSGYCFATMEIVVSPDVVLSCQPLCATCNGVDDGRIKVTVTAGTPPYLVSLFDAYDNLVDSAVITYQDGMHIFSDLDPQDSPFRLVVEDGGACSNEKTDIFVCEPAPIGMPSDFITCILDAPTNLSATTDVGYCQTLDGYGNVVPMLDGGSWSGPGVTDNNTSDGDAVFDPYVAGEGMHTLTFRANSDPSGYCFDTMLVTVVPDPTIVIDYGFPQPPYCCDDARVNLTVIGAFPGGAWTIYPEPGLYGFIPNDAAGTAVFDPAAAGPGTYVIGYDSMQGYCEDSIEITVFECPQATASQMCATCFGFDDGQLEVTVSGGAPEYTVTVTGPNYFNETQVGYGGQSVFTFLDLEVGLYVITVIDENGCAVTLNVEVFEPELILTANDIVIENCAFVACITAEEVELRGMLNEVYGCADLEDGGVWSGPGVTYPDSGSGTALFDPSVVGVGMTILRFTANSNRYGECFKDVKVTIFPELEVEAGGRLNACRGEEFCYDLIVTNPIRKGNGTPPQNNPSGFITVTGLLDVDWEVSEVFDCTGGGEKPYIGPKDGIWMNSNKKGVTLDEDGTGTWSVGVLKPGQSICITICASDPNVGNKRLGIRVAQTVKKP